jgi:hypothetical protein
MAWLFATRDTAVIRDAQCSENLFVNWIVHDPRRSRTEVWLYSEFRMMDKVYKPRNSDMYLTLPLGGGCEVCFGRSSALLDEKWTVTLIRITNSSSTTVTVTRYIRCWRQKEIPLLKFVADPLRWRDPSFDTPWDFSFRPIRVAVKQKRSNTHHQTSEWVDIIVLSIIALLNAIKIYHSVTYIISTNASATSFRDKVPGSSSVPPFLLLRSVRVKQPKVACAPTSHALRLITGCLKKSFTTLKAYINSFRRHVPCLKLSLCNKTHRVLPGIVTVRYDFRW